MAAGSGLEDSDPEKARYGRGSIEGIGERQTHERRIAERRQQTANRLIETNSRVRWMSGKERDKGMNIAAKSLSGAWKRVRHGERVQETQQRETARNYFFPFSDDAAAYTFNSFSNEKPVL